jgi:hypothetical protein
MNDYEQAIARLEAARQELGTANQRLAVAEDEMDDANANLAACESSPGVPLPQYRQNAGA